MRYFNFVFLTLLLLNLGLAVSGQSLTADEIITRHLNSIGTASRRQSLKNIFVTGLSGFDAKIPVVQGRGKAVVVSDAENLYFLMSLNSHEYPFEKIGVFGNKVSIPFGTAGQRSLLGKFMAEHSIVLTSSLFCGSMSLRWISKIPDLRLKSSGKKKIDGHLAYGVDVVSPGIGSGDFTIRLYFDTETFRHVRTEYHREVQADTVTFGRQNQTVNATVDLREEFSEFKEADGLTFPYSYKVTLTSNAGTSVYETSWSIMVNGYNLNQNLAPDFFTFDTIAN